MKCCDHEVDTAYCPACGTRTNVSALRQVEKYLAGRLGAAKTARASCVQFAEKYKWAEDVKTKRLEKRDRQVEKYASWLEAVTRAAELEESSNGS